MFSWQRSENYLKGTCKTYIGLRFKDFRLRESIAAVNPKIQKYFRSDCSDLPEEPISMEAAVGRSG
ncbi:MAG: hypothetical protein C4324_10880 [Blastocatellia bacterium]